MLQVKEMVIKNRDNPPPPPKDKQIARNEWDPIPGRTAKSHFPLRMTMERGSNIEKGKHRNDQPRPD